MFRFVNARMLAVSAALSLVMSAAYAVSPHPDAVKQFREQGVLEQKLELLRVHDSLTWANRTQADIDEQNRRSTRLSALATDAEDTMRAAIILVDFPDFRYDQAVYDNPGAGQITSSVAGTREMFDSMVFSRQGIDAAYNPTGSFTEFYLQASQGKLLIIGEVFGWYTMPLNYYEYVGADDGLSGGALLARHAVLAANDAGVDFSPFANGGTVVPGFMVVHAGPGAETGAYGIWSHQGKMDSSVIVDNVLIGDYAMDPEEMYNTLSSMGVFTHEWGHVLGLPDVYDVSYQGNGLGMYSLMSGGSWNNNGKSPACLDAWCRKRLGFVETIWLDRDSTDVEILQMETGGPIYGLKDALSGANVEYWLVENRQKVGQFDSTLPSGGLYIYHVDEAAWPQSNPNRYAVALEQADGRFQLESGASEGDAGDPWPGSTGKRDFSDFTTPNAHVNATGAMSEVSVWNISDSDSLMTANLDVTHSRPFIVLTGDSVDFVDAAPGGDGDGQFEPGETISITVEAGNLSHRQGFHPRCYLSSDNPDLVFVNNGVSMGGSISHILNGITQSPVQFTVPATFPGSVVEFTVSIRSDAVYNPQGDQSFVSDFYFTYAIGSTELLVVDDDNGRSDQQALTAALDDMHLLYDVWTKSSQGSPTSGDLDDYKAVFWMTGDIIFGGQLIAADVSAMKAFLDAGGHLALASHEAVSQLDVLDSAFLADYFHATLAGSSASSGSYYRGLADHPLGENVRYRSSYIAPVELLAPVGAGQAAFVLTNSGNTVDYGTTGVTYEGDYTTVLLTFGLEFVRSDVAGFGTKSDLIERLLSFFGMGGATAVDEPGEAGPALPCSFVLEQNYPNPFNPSTVIAYSVNDGEVERTVLTVYNLLGRRVATLVDRLEGNGSYQVTWNGSASDGSRAASGTYFYRLMRGDHSASRKMILIK